jgi:hypothetical protein
MENETAVTVNGLFATARTLLANRSSIGQAGVAKMPAVQPFLSVRGLRIGDRRTASTKP